MIKRSIALAVPTFAALGQAGEDCEKAGLDRAWTTELRNRDAVVRAQHVATRTTNLAVGTGIAYAFTRHPIALAGSAAEGQAATGGRLTIGVGVGTAHTRGEYGLSFDHPAPRLAEYIELMRAAIDADGGLEFHGRFYDVRMPGFSYGHPRSLLDTIRIYGAALMPTALKALSRTCDGIALHPFGHFERYLDEVVLPSTSDAAARASRQRPAIAAWIIACALEDPIEARVLARAQIALYSAQPSFAKFFEHTPWARQAETIRESISLGAGRLPWRDLGTQYVPDDMLDGLAVAGTPGQVAKGIELKEEQLERQGVDELTLQIPAVAMPPGDTSAVVNGLISAAYRSPR